MTERFLTPSRRRKCIDHVRHRSTQRKVPLGRADEDHLSDDIIDLDHPMGARQEGLAISSALSV
ncbi:hypothetical protein AKJ29_04620 [Aliiroseovarius crassostreae]|uniref:Uncharacterized protein n=1 Tax=Aliiroseovarius crassostreae TaxID=154981 RepID=A0A0P7JLC1_9RHOB|nr:hypothetical protein AKJ29_04620 [Aliiroseovarius crassostreae]